MRLRIILRKSPRLGGRLIHPLTLNRDKVRVFSVHALDHSARFLLCGGDHGSNLEPVFQALPMDSEREVEGVRDLRRNIF